MAKNKISISFSEKHLHIYNYLKTKDNISSYLCTLVEDDINNGQDRLDLDNKIRKIINDVLKDKQIIGSSPSSIDTTNKDSAITDEDIDTILNLF
ncbi:hypothetical protein HMPREF1982_00383 [Clostridiales bacterium oral taxon 876 str. F0540]|nr:hypothetical protein HMPREF1982_00383 [Clostridiales bacterium oral taxon 876 str. F0540]